MKDLLDRIVAIECEKCQETIYDKTNYVFTCKYCGHIEKIGGNKND